MLPFCFKLASSREAIKTSAFSIGSTVFSYIGSVAIGHLDVGVLQQVINLVFCEQPVFPQNLVGIVQTHIQPATTWRQVSMAVAMQVE
jgi:hypothetical protein